MARRLSPGFCVLLISVAVVQAQPPTRPQGWKQLAGVWRPYSREYDGKKELAPQDIVDSLELVVARNKVILKEDGKVKDFKVSVKLYPDKSPAWVDFIVTVAGNRFDPMKTCPGIYKVEGDTLTICFREPGVDVKRPTAFATKKGDAAILVVFKRKKTR